MPGSAVLRVDEEGADAERLDTLVRYLRAELTELDSVEVGELKQAAPEGARAIELAAVGALLVSLAKGGALRSVVEVARGWLDRGPGGRTIRIEIDGDVLEISDASVKQQDRLVDVFVTRHTAG
jgi:hypothetical protein